MPSTFLVSDFSNSHFGPLSEPLSQNATLTFLGCPSRHTEINLNFDLIQAISSGTTATGSNPGAKCEWPPADEGNSMSSKSPALRSSHKVKRTQLEPASSQSSKKEIVRNQAGQSGENSKRCREAKNTSLERGESQRKTGNDERVPMFYYESSPRSTEKSPRRAASLDKNSHTSSEGNPQRQRSRERTGEVKVFSRLRTCLKGLKQKSQAGQLTETQISNMQLSRALEHKAELSMHRQLRLPKAQGDMEILSKGAESFKHMTEKPVDSKSVLVDSNIRNYAGCSVENANPAAEQCHSHQRSRTRGYPTIDKMFIDVLKTLIMQSGPESGSGITSIYDSHETCETCTYKMENEIGKSNNAAGGIPSGDEIDAAEIRDEAWSHEEGARGGMASVGDRSGGSIQCDGDKNCNHSVVGYDEYDDDKLGVFDAELTDTPEVLFDVFFQEVPRSTIETHEAPIRNTQDVSQRSKECVNLNEIQYQSNATLTKRRDSVTDVTYPNPLSEALDNVPNGWEAIQFSHNHNNSVNDIDDLERTDSNGRSGEDEIHATTSAADKNAQGRVSGESRCTVEQSQEQSLDQCQDTYNNSIVIKLTPPSPLQPSSPQGLSSPHVSSTAFDKCALLSVPEVYMSLRARLPSAALLELAADERFRSNDVVEKELEDLCHGKGNGITDLYNRPNSSQIGRNFITAYIERAKEVLRNVRVRPMSPQNVLDKMNKYCEKAKDEVKLIKSWSFSELVTPLCKGGMYRSTIGKFRFTDFKSKWDKFQCDGFTDFKTEDTPGKDMPSARPGDANSPIFCLNNRVQNDAAFDSQVESLDAPGSSQGYGGAHPSSLRPQPVLGQASTAADNCRIVKGRENIQESTAADKTLNSKPELFECCERKSAFFRYGETSTDIKVTTYPRHRDTREALVEMNEEEAIPSGQQPCGVDELNEFKIDTMIKRDNSAGAERVANRQTSLSCSSVQHKNANTESSQGQNVFSTSVPLKSQSLFLVGRETTQGESSDVMSMISQGVTLKRYPSFADLTDLIDGGHQKQDEPTEAKQGSAQATENESYDPVQDKQTLTKISTASTNVTPFDDCPEIYLVGRPVEEVEPEKLTPPNSPDLGVLVGARVQTIVSLLESCSALRTDSERAPNHSVHIEPNSRSTLCQSKQNKAGSNSPGSPDGRQNEMNLPSPPVTSPGDSTSDTLDDVIFPAETYEHCIPSTSQSAAAGQQRFKSRPYSNACGELKDEIMHENTPNPDSQALGDDLFSNARQAKVATETRSEEYPSRSRRNICEPSGIITCKESDSFSLSGSDSESQLKDVCNQDMLSDEEEYNEQDKDVEIMQPAPPECTTKPCIFSRGACEPGQIIKTQSAGQKTRMEKERKLTVSSNHRKEDAESSKAELKHKAVPKARAVRVNAVEPGETCSGKLPRKIKWVTESPSEEDEARSPASVSVSNDRTLKLSKDKPLVSYPTQSMNVAQCGNATSGPNRGTPDEKDGSDLHSSMPESKNADSAAGSAGGSKSDSNNNVSTLTGNRWIRLHKGIPFNLKASKNSTKQVPYSDDRKSDASSKDKLPISTSSSKRKVCDNGVNVDGMKKVISLSEVSQVVGVPDPEDIYPVCLSKANDVTIISNDTVTVDLALCHHVNGASPMDFLKEEEEEVRDYGNAKGKPYCSIRREESFVIDPRKVAHSKQVPSSRPYHSVRREETFSSDPRKVAHSKRYSARSSQSLQLHQPVLSALPPRPIRSSYYTQAPRRWKRSDATDAIFFDKTSPDVSPEARDIGCSKGEICVVPKLSKCLWEGTTNLHGRENTKDHICVTNPSPQNTSRLRSRLQRSDAKAAPRARDFVQRSSLQIDRCDKMIKKSTDTIRASQVMVERSRRRLASTADEMRRLASKYISIF